MRDPSEIMSAYFDDSLREGEREELRAWLSADPERMRQFVIESVIHSRLRDVLVQHDMQGLVVGDPIDPQHVASLLDEEEAASARRSRAAAEQARQAELAAARQEEMLDRKLLRIEEPRTPKWPVYAGFAVAAALLLIVGRLTSPAPPLEPSRRALPTPAGPPIIAELSHAFDAAVHSDIRPVATGAKLHAGVLRFDRGVAELKFVSGARIVVEAPAELELMSGDRAKLISGRAVAHVPQEALGFTLHSQAAAFVDLGTEFGVEVAASGDTAIHVLDGEVALVRKHSAPDERSRTLQVGQASRVSSDGARVESIPFQNDRFLRRVPASAYELAVLRSQPLAYWRLDHWDRGAPLISEGRLALSATANPGITPVYNRAAEGVANGPARAARFDGDHDGIDVAEDAALGEVSNSTYEAWVLPGDDPTGPRRIYSTFDRPRAGLAIGVVEGNSYHLPDDGLKFQLTVYGVYDCLSATPIARNEWVHLVATIDAGGTPTLYVNGEQVERRFRRIEDGAEEELNPAEPAWLKEDVAKPDSWTAEGSTPIGVATAGFARIGRNPLGTESQISPERWLGQISNVAVYNRVLSPDEVRRHFRATRESRVLQQDVKTSDREQ